MAHPNQPDNESPSTATSVVVLGDAAVGKTALLWALTGREFGRELPPATLMTTGIDEPLKTSFGSFIGFAGESSAEEIAKRIEEAQPTAALFVIDARNDMAHSNLDSWYSAFNQCTRHKDIDKFLVITKCDTATPRVDERNLTSKYGFKAIHRTSAMQGDGIQELRSDVRNSLLNNNDDEEEFGEVALVVRLLSEQLCELVARNSDVLRDIEWRDLERLLSRALDEIGFDVTLTPPAKDGGKDIVANCTVERETKTYYIEIKHWRSKSQPSDSHISDFVAVNACDDTDGGLFISSTGFTQSVYGRIGELMKQRVRLGQEEKIVSLCQHYVRKRSGVWQPDTLLPELLFENTITEAITM